MVESLALMEKMELEGPSPMAELPSLEGAEEILGYKFENNRLLEEAFTDSSFPDKGFSYERLEYIGDSVLNFSLQRNTFSTANIDTEKLTRVAFKHGFHRFLRHNKPLLEDQVLADIVESTVGAVFIDTNYCLDSVWKVFKDVLEPIISRETVKIHPVTELYEECQKRNLKVKFVDSWRKSIAFHVLIEDKLVGRATYGFKKDIAYNRAAKDALDNIRFLFTQSSSS
ncbi:ribonuclease 3-like protein 3 [Euphorbia lathyris]|uniref:ribonuclease 3-like protein 3 n=1 Tax=Euphorbia lathyris TaxID=212925 RepID=UPI0033141E96